MAGDWPGLRRSSILGSLAASLIQSPKKEDAKMKKVLLLVGLVLLSFSMVQAAEFPAKDLSVVAV